MLCMIIYTADIDAVNMEFLVCWNLDLKISEVSSVLRTVLDDPGFCMVL